MKMEVDQGEDDDDDDGGDDTFSGTTGGIEDHPLVREWKAARKRRIAIAASEGVTDGTLVNQLRVLLDASFIASLFDRYPCTSS
jgi:hypothetical protein